MSEDREDRTEAATPRRLERAAEQGDVPVSREASTFAAFAAAAGATAVLANSGGHAFAWFRQSLAGAGHDRVEFLFPALRALATAVLLPAALALTAAASATLLQTGFLIHGGALAPQLDRISPLRGIKRLASPETLVQAAKAVLRVLLLGYVLVLALRPMLPGLPALLHTPPAGLLAILPPVMWRLLAMLGGAQIIFVVFDIFWVRARHAAKLRMTKQEVRDEHKETDGNPLVRQRLRQLRAARAKRRMMAEVQRATVVVTNPTHYAVALAYARGSATAPRLVAKGVDEVAARIREEARNHRVPIVANPPLARALFRLELETEIPPEHFKAVAEIVAYIWRLNARRPRY